MSLQTTFYYVTSVWSLSPLLSVWTGREPPSSSTTPPRHSRGTLGQMFISKPCSTLWTFVVFIVATWMCDPNLTMCDTKVFSKVFYVHNYMLPLMPWQRGLAPWCSLEPWTTAAPLQTAVLRGRICCIISKHHIASTILLFSHSSSCLYPKWGGVNSDTLSRSR